jgi:hypothetical protein
MKITLRKVSHNLSSDTKNYHHFTLLPLTKNKSAISLSNINIGIVTSQQYGVDTHDMFEKYLDNWNKRQVIKIWGDINIIIVPSTQKSNSKSITNYTEQLCDCLSNTSYLHFTHFGYLKNAFPQSQIKKILSVFLIKDYIGCEVCWDIDEKYFDDMYNLLKNELSELNKNTLVEYYDESNFVWSTDYELEKEIIETTKRRIGKLRNEQIMKQIAKRLKNERVENNKPNLSTVDVGNAGEYYALSLFIRMGFIIGKAPEGTADYDLLVMSKDRLSFKPIQVKTITEGGHWLLNIKHETIIHNLFYCFIHLTDVLTIPRVFIIPSEVVSHVISMCHKIYLSLPNKSGELHKDSHMRTLKFDFSTLIKNVNLPRNYLNSKQIKFIEEHKLGWLDEYENNFNLLTD